MSYLLGREFVLMSECFTVEVSQKVWHRMLLKLLVLLVQSGRGLVPVSTLVTIMYPSVYRDLTVCLSYFSLSS